MTAPEQDQPGYVLHRRAYRETSFLVDLLTRDHGRVSGVVRGARSRKGAPLEPFVSYVFSWRGKGQLVTITGYDVLAQRRLTARSLYAGLYANEILVRTLRAEDPVDELYQHYERTIADLEDDVAIEPVLRRFEIALLRELGYELVFDFDASTGAQVQPDCHYRYVHELGFEAAVAGQSNVVAGAHLLAIAAGDFTQGDTRRVAKWVLRRALRPLIGDKPLVSRALFARGPGRA